MQSQLSSKSAMPCLALPCLIQIHVYPRRQSPSPYFLHPFTIRHTHRLPLHLHLHLHLLPTSPAIHSSDPHHVRRHNYTPSISYLPSSDPLNAGVQRGHTRDFVLFAKTQPPFYKRSIFLANFSIRSSFGNAMSSSSFAYGVGTSAPVIRIAGAWR